jgi:hypothetical protein
MNLDRNSIHARDILTDLRESFHVEQSPTAGQRLYLIRLACGDGVRTPLSMREFAERVLAITGVEYQHATISMLERDKQEWRRKDLLTFAAADPLNRGPSWLGAFDVPLPKAIEAPANAKLAPPQLATFVPRGTKPEDAIRQREVDEKRKPLKKKAKRRRAGGS